MEFSVILQRVKALFVGLCVLVSLFILFPGFAKADVAVWQFGDADTQITLFGTIHILEPGNRWLTGPLEQTFKEADALVVEIAPAEIAKIGPMMASAGKLAPNTSLRMEIGNALYGDVRRQLALIGMPREAFDTARPWFAALSINVTALVKEGFDPNSGADKLLIDAATRGKMPIYGLETAALQSSLFTTMSKAEEKHFLMLTLRDMADAKNKMRQMQAAWLAGDESALNTIINEGIAEMPALGEKLLFKRNQDWLDKMEQLLERPGKFFVAVGAGHLIGDNSLNSMLAAKGHTVRRVQ